MFTFWGTRLPAFSPATSGSRGPYRTHTPHLKVVVGSKDSEQSPERRLHQLFCLLEGQRLKTVTVSTGHSADLTCPAEEDKGQANTTVVHIYFGVNKCIPK